MAARAVPCKVDRGGRGDSVAAMTAPRLLTLYLDAPTLARHRAGEHNFLARLTSALTGRGWAVTAEVSTPQARRGAPDRPGHALYHMEEPTHAAALTCRRAYIGAFWRIEATARRWDWPVARAAFDPASVDAAPARRFADNWRKRLFGTPEVPPLGQTVLVPLQGLLRRHRSFQSMSPVEMLEVLARHFPDRPILATTHPREVLDAADRAALAALTRSHPNLRLQDGGSDAALANAGLVATQNSSVAFSGFVLHRPALLFADIDFHHIAASVPRDGMAALSAAGAPADFDRYLFWFLRRQAINAYAEDTEAQILAVLARHGWPVE